MTDGIVQIPMGDMVNAYKALVLTPLGDVAMERHRQDEIFGEQNHPMVDPLFAQEQRDFYAEEAELWKRSNATRGPDSPRRLAWDGILLEEAYEALAEEDPAKQREELIQVAAVCVAMVESLDRAAAKTSSDVGGNEAE